MRRAISASAFAIGGVVERGPAAWSSSASSGMPSAHSTSQAASSKALPVPWPNETPACLEAGGLCGDQFDQGHRGDGCCPILGRAARRASARRFASASCDEALEHAAVDVLQRLDARDLDRFVDLVDRRVDRAELDHLRADLRDEAAVRGAAGGRQLGRDAGDRADRVGQRVAERAGRRQERLAAERPGDAEVEAVAVEDRFDAGPAAIAASIRCRSGS